MIIKQKQVVPKVLSLKKTKGKQETVTLEFEFEIHDELIGKLLAIINEVFAREKEVREKDEPIKFPAFPFPFYQITRETKDGTTVVGWNNNPFKDWFETSIKATIEERMALIEKLAELGTLEISAESKPASSHALDFQFSILEIDKSSLASLYTEVKTYQKTLEKEPFLDIKNWSYEKKLFFLRKTYQEIIRILDAVGGTGYVIISNPALNYFYTVFCSLVDTILLSKDFKELEKSKPEIYESLIGDINDINLGWEFLKNDMLSFFGKIEKAYISIGMPEIELGSLFVDFFNRSDAEIKNHISEVNKASKKLIGQVERPPEYQHKSEKGEERNATPIEKTSLSGQVVTFEDTKPAITINGKSCPLPPAKNEDYLSRVVFSRPVGEFVDWSIIYREMAGYTGMLEPNDDEIGSGKNKKMVRDTVERLNDRIKEVFRTDDNLLTWQNKSIKRNF